MTDDDVLRRLPNRWNDSRGRNAPRRNDPPRSVSSRGARARPQTGTDPLLSEAIKALGRIEVERSEQPPNRPPTAAGVGWRSLVPGQDRLEWPPVPAPRSDSWTTGEDRPKAVLKPVLIAAAIAVAVVVAMMLF